MKEGINKMQIIKNKYEALFIIRPELKEEEVKAACKVITDSIAKHQGEITGEDGWGKRTLAFPMKKGKEGFYYKVNFTAPSDAIAKLQGMYKLNSQILRVMITRR